MEFQDEDIEEGEVDFNGASRTPHRIHGIGTIVYWQDCNVTLMRYVDGDLEYIRAIERRTGKGKLKVGLALVFLGHGGKAKAE